MCSLCWGGWFQAPPELRLSLEWAKESVSHLHLEVQILVSILLLFPSSLATSLSVISSWVTAKPSVGQGESLNTRRENKQLPSSWGDFVSSQNVCAQLSEALQHAALIHSCHPHPSLLWLACCRHTPGASVPILHQHPLGKPEI